MLFVLGTGGTTPIPRLLLGGAFDILTLDRFTIWATIAALPLFGSLVSALSAARPARSPAAFSATERGPPRLLSAHAALLLAAVTSANFTHFDLYNLTESILNPSPRSWTKDQHDRWRYLTLGFGDQMAFVGASTTATTVDGNYHSARRLPELTSRSVERLEGAKFGAYLVLAHSSNS